MNDIQVKEHRVEENIKSRDEIKLIINNNNDPTIIESLTTFIDELNECGRTFKYMIDKQSIDENSTEVSIRCVFDTNYIHMVCNDLENEINYNAIIIEKLSKQDNLSPIAQTLLDNRIDDLTQRNDELIKEQRTVKMQLFNAISKRDKLIREITTYINNSIEDCITTYISATTDMEKAFMDMDGLTSTVHEIKQQAN